MRPRQNDRILKSQKNREIRIIFGISLLIGSVLLLVACASFLFHWKQDFSSQEFLHVRTVTTHNLLSKVGASVSHFLIYDLFGIASFLFPYLLFLTGIHLIANNKVSKLFFIWIKGLLRILWLSVCLGFLHHYNPMLGGIVGYEINDYLIDYVGLIGLIGILFFIFLSFAVIEWNYQPELQKTKQAAIKKPKPISKKSPKPKPSKSKGSGFTLRKKKPVVKPKETQLVNGAFDPRSKLPGYVMPPHGLLKSTPNIGRSYDREELETNIRIIKQTLESHKLQVKVAKATVGPTVTLYELIPEKGVRIGGIKNREQDIALALSAISIRIIAPIPGKGTVGIEVPNTKRRMVSIKSVLEAPSFQKIVRENSMGMPISLGETVIAKNFEIDLAQMPHLLVAGATGQGKSVGLNTIIMSILFTKHPQEVKFVMIDPKMVELKIYSKLTNHFLAKMPHVIESVITNHQEAKDTLKSLCQEMDNRYNLLKKASCRNLMEYNLKIRNRSLPSSDEHRFLPYIVLIIDEFADLIMASGKEVEHSITRLAQLSRAVGIHLILATQRPSVNVITGLIKANFPARIAFKVVSAMDSRTILDQSGANQLIGRGDMLFSFQAETTRIQCAYVATSEVESVVQFISSQRGDSQPYLLPEVKEENENGDGMNHSGALDKLFSEAAELIVQSQKGSTSHIQRRLSLGYNRAGRIMDQLEQAGIVGPAQGSKPRSVLIGTIDELKTHLEDLSIEV
ncbi:MAG: DNA translocase FtsK 4TM domain-containing protein [Flavobacteriaceae bacterium]|nr:DNA translocase FtsK 4TM domain-containing protein [Flavobacteriaceae bacterium]